MTVRVINSLYSIMVVLFIVHDSIRQNPRILQFFMNYFDSVYHDIIP